MTSSSIESGPPATNRRLALRYTLGAPLVVAGVDWSGFFGPDWFPIPSERLTKAVEHPRRLDAAVLDELEATNLRHIRLNSQLGTRVMLGSVMAHLALVTELLRDSVPPELRPRLASITAEAGREAVFVCRDQRQLAAARAHYRQAAEVAHEGGDRSGEVCALAHWAKTATEGSGSAQALSLIEGADGLLGQGVPPKVHAYVDAAKAEVHAIAGNVDNALRALDHAQEWLLQASGSREPPWLFWFDQADLDSRMGGCYVRTGRLDDAETVIAAALSGLDPSSAWKRAIPLIHLATVRTRQEEIDEACNLLGQAVELTAEAESSRVLQRIYDLRSELQPWSTTAAVNALDEQLMAA